MKAIALLTFLVRESSKQLSHLLLSASVSFCILFFSFLVTMTIMSNLFGRNSNADNSDHPNAAKNAPNDSPIADNVGNPNATNATNPTIAANINGSPIADNVGDLNAANPTVAGSGNSKPAAQGATNSKVGSPTAAKSTTGGGKPAATAAATKPLSGGTNFTVMTTNGVPGDAKSATLQYPIHDNFDGKKPAGMHVTLSAPSTTPASAQRQVAETAHISQDGALMVKNDAVADNPTFDSLSVALKAHAASISSIQADVNTQGDAVKKNSKRIAFAVSLAQEVASRNTVVDNFMPSLIQNVNNNAHGLKSIDVFVKMSEEDKNGLVDFVKTLKDFKGGAAACECLVPEKQQALTAACDLLEPLVKVFQDDTTDENTKSQLKQVFETIAVNANLLTSASTALKPLVEAIESEDEDQKNNLRKSLESMANNHARLSSACTMLSPLLAIMAGTDEEAKTRLTESLANLAEPAVATEVVVSTYECQGKERREKDASTPADYQQGHGGEA